MKLIDKNPALLLIDMQQGFEDEAYWGGNRNNPDLEKKAEKLLLKWRALRLPVFHVRHSSTTPQSRLHPTHPGFAFIQETTPLEGEPVITKEVNSGFIGTNLKEQLDEKNINTLVILGLTTNHCVSTTSRMAGNFGYEVILLRDVTATFDRIGLNGEKHSSHLVHEISLASLNEEFAEVINSEELLKRLG